MVLKMNIKEKYYIKYEEGNLPFSGPLYWRKSSSEWVVDLKRATRFPRNKGIVEVGNILVNKGLKTKLVYDEDYVPKENRIKSPRSGLFVIVDGYGNYVDVYPRNEIERVQRRCFDLAKTNPTCGPFSIWRWKCEDNSVSGKFIYIKYN